VEDLGWTNLSKKTQELLIRSYVIDLAGVMNLNTKDKRLLLQTLRLGIAMKIITKCHISMEKGKIISIKGLAFDETNKVFTIKSNK
jgi:hypothetical protein